MILSVLQAILLYMKSRNEIETPSFVNVCVTNIYSATLLAPIYCHTVSIKRRVMALECSAVYHRSANFISFLLRSLRLEIAGASRVG